MGEEGFGGVVKSASGNTAENVGNDGFGEAEEKREFCEIMNLERWSNFRILGNVGSLLLTTARTASSSYCCAQQLAALTRHCNAVS